MTSIRKSVIFAMEDKLGGGLPAKGHYIQAPPHSFISHTPNRSTNRLNASGTKKFDAIAYGKVSGTWDWSFVLDYDYLEPLALIFECVNGHVQKYGADSAQFAGLEKSTSTEPIIAMRRAPTYDNTTFSKIELTSSQFEELSTYADNTIYHVSKEENGETTYTDYCCRKNELTPCVSGWDDFACVVYVYNNMYFSEPVEVGGEVKSKPDIAYIFRDTNGVYTYYFQSAGYSVDETGAVFRGSTPITKYVIDSSTRYLHTFSKVDFGRVRSFTVRQVILNEMAGGPLDEVLEMRGCIVKSVTFRQAAGASQIQVSLSGANIWDKMWLGHIEHNDYRDHAGQLIEFGCVYLGDVDQSTKLPQEANKAGQVDSWNIEINNNVEMVDTTCGPRSVNYEEGQSEYSFNLTLYSINPLKLQQRLYTGGQDIVGTMPGVQKTGSYLWIPEPMCKNLKPLPRADVLSYNTCVKDLGGLAENTVEAYTSASKSLHVIVKEIVIKSVGWQRGEGQKLQDSVNAECREITIETVGNVANWLANDKNYVKSPMGPRWNDRTHQWTMDEHRWDTSWRP